MARFQYCMSKTILNMYMRKLSVELESVRVMLMGLRSGERMIDSLLRPLQEGFTTAMYSPGFVKTNL